MVTLIEDTSFPAVRDDGVASHSLVKRLDRNMKVSHMHRGHNSDFVLTLSLAHQRDQNENLVLDPLNANQGFVTVYLYLRGFARFIHTHTRLPIPTAIQSHL
jgi:hypothetical protein